MKRCAPCSPNTRRTSVISAGLSWRAGAAALPPTPYGPPPTMRYCFYSASNVTGHALTPQARLFAAPFKTSTQTTVSPCTTRTAPWSAASKNTYALLKQNPTDAPSHGPAGRIPRFFYPIPHRPGRLSRTPRRHDHGAMLSPRTHIPRAWARAARSNAPSRNASQSYRRYHQASPSAKSTSVQSAPAPFTIRTTSRPQASPRSNVTCSGPTARSAANRRRATLYPNCPTSGASSPYRRPRTTTPYTFIKSTVSPSQTRTTDQ